jgi:hypothetical protein
MGTGVTLPVKPPGKKIVKTAIGNARIAEQTA